MTARLRFEAPSERFKVVLIEPEIPQNTGSIARLVAATKSSLHLVGKLGFQIDEQAVRRAGLDYWHLVDLTHHASWEAFRSEAEEQQARMTRARTGAPEGPVDELTRHEAFQARAPASRCVGFSAHATTSYLDFVFQPGDALVFGKESVGLDPALVSALEPHVLGIPTAENTVRSLNLANAVSIVLYEALRQVGALASARAAT